MKIELTKPEDTAAAEDSDISDEDLRAALAELFARDRDPNRKALTGAEIVDLGYRDGTIGSRKDITDSVAYVDEMRERRKRRRGA